MLKIFLLSSMAIFCLGSALAQDSSRWSVMAVAGYTTSNMAGSSSGNYGTVAGQGNNQYYNNGTGGQKLRMGWNGGIQVAYELGRRVFIQAGLNLVVRGGAIQLNEYFPSGSFNSQEVPVTGKSVFAFNYLTIPVVWKLYLGKHRPIYLEAGAYYGSLLAASENGSFVYNGSNIHYTNNLNSNYNLSDLGYILGMGWERKLSKRGKLFIDLQVDRSQFTIGSVSVPGGKPELFNQSLSLSAGYRFTL